MVGWHESSLQICTGTSHFPSTAFPSTPFPPLRNGGPGLYERSKNDRVVDGLARAQFWTRLPLLRTGPFRACSPEALRWGCPKRGRPLDQEECNEGKEILNPGGVQHKMFTADIHSIDISYRSSVAQAEHGFRPIWPHQSDQDS